MKKLLLMVGSIILFGLFLIQLNENTMGLKMNDQLPEFCLKNQNGEEICSNDMLNRGPIVIFFYPKDDTPGCTKQACAFRDHYADLLEAGSQVYGISSDSERSHTDFQDKFSLPYDLLSDPNKKIRKQFGVPSSLLGLIPGRATYVFNSKGVLIKEFVSQLEAEEHVQQALKAIATIQ